MLAIDNTRTTPAHKVNDGEDFVPTKRFYLFGQHSSAIAAAGPIAGPIAACLAFGWLPGLLWIALGVVLIGAVDDFTRLAASVSARRLFDRGSGQRAHRLPGRAGDDGVYLDRPGLCDRRFCRHYRWSFARRSTKSKAPRSISIPEERSPRRVFFICICPLRSDSAPRPSRPSVFDTIDVVMTRLGRYLIQELTGLRTPFGATLATLITVGLSALILSMAGEGFFSTRTHGRSRRRALTSSAAG